MPLEEPFYLNRCIQQIEEKQRWGLSKHWKNKEYQKLSEQIIEVSKIYISSITLKRLFGKVETSKDYNPQLDTKNALALYLGYEDWEDFKRQNPVTVPDREGLPPLKDYDKLSIADSGRLTAEVVREKKPKAVPEAGNRKKPRAPINLWLLAPLGLIAGSAIVYAVFYFYSSGEPGTAGTATLTAVNIKASVPFTPVYEYDISKVKADSVFIEFGDKTKELLPRDQDRIAYTYLIPHFYKVKLTAKKQTLAQLNVHALSNGWKGVIFYTNNRHHGVPVDNQQVFRKKGELYMSQKYIDSIGINRLSYWVSYRNIDDFAASGDQCTLETRFLNKDSTTEWKFCDVITQIVGEEGVHRSHFLNPGVSSHAEIRAGEVKVLGKYKDLAAFGQDMSQWHTGRMEVRDRKVTFYMDGKQIYTLSYTVPIGKIKGIILTTRGTGSIDHVKLFDGEDKLVYEDHFE